MTTTPNKRLYEDYKTFRYKWYDDRPMFHNDVILRLAEKWKIPCAEVKAIIRNFKALAKSKTMILDLDKPCPVEQSFTLNVKSVVEDEQDGYRIHDKPHPRALWYRTKVACPGCKQPLMFAIFFFTRRFWCEDCKKPFKEEK